MTHEKKEVIRDLMMKAAQARHDLIELTYVSGYSHLGGPLSACDAATALYHHFMRFNKDMLQDPCRDRFILSKGHNGDIIYCILAELGLYPLQELLDEYKQFKGRWGEHPNRQHNPGFEISSGSLGHGLPIAAGMAWAGRMDKSDYRVFCLVGDGELQEGSNWEAIMNAGHNQFGNLIAIVDQNKCQGTRLVADTCVSENMKERWEAFGWNVIDVADGNDMVQVYEALEMIPPRGVLHAKPTCILLHTIKGCGIDFMEDGQAKWHAGGIGDDKREYCHQSVDKKRDSYLKKLDEMWGDE